MAQRRRKEQQMKKRQRTITALCIAGGIGAVALSLTACILIFDPFASSEPIAAPQATALPYSASEPFSLSDLTAEQIAQLRRDGRMTVSDGPRGVSVGDTLEKLIERLPSEMGMAAPTLPSTGMQSDEEITRYCTDFLDRQNAGEQTGMQSDEEMVLYCAEYFENQNGIMTALPPRGMLNVNNGKIVVTLLAPTSAYPAGTKDSYGAYEHVYCLYSISPETMTIDSIVLGIDQ